MSDHDTYKIYLLEILEMTERTRPFHVVIGHYASAEVGSKAQIGIARKGGQGTAGYESDVVGSN